MSQMRKLRPREVTGLVQGHTTCQWANMLWPGATTGSKYRPVWKWERPPLFGACWHHRSRNLLEQDANYLFKKESEDGALTQLPASRRLAGPLHPPHPPCPSLPPGSPSPGEHPASRLQQGLRRAVRRPGQGSRSHGSLRRWWQGPPGTTAPAVPPRPKCQVRVGEGEARGSSRSAQRSASPPGFSGCGGPAVSGWGTRPPRVPAHAHPPLSVFPTAAGCWSGPGSCSSDCRGAAPSRAGAVRAAGGAAEGEWTQVRRPRRSRERGRVCCTAAGCGRGPLAAVESLREHQPRRG